MINEEGVVLEEEEDAGKGEEVSKEKLHGTRRGELLRGRKEGCCEGKENSFPSNPQEDSLRCQKNVARH